MGFADVITLPYKIAGAPLKLALNLCTGKTEMSDLNPCGGKDTTTSSSSDGGKNNGIFSNPLGGMFGGGSGKNTKYLDCSWNNLPGNARSAAETLGYNESNWAKKWAPCEDKHWGDLSEAERSAATELGWDKSAWNNKYEDLNFEDLPSHVQDAATTLGFTQQMWNNDQWPTSTDQWWNDISDEHKKALNTLGYSQYDWH